MELVCSLLLSEILLLGILLYIFNVHGICFRFATNIVFLIIFLALCLTFGLLFNMHLTQLELLHRVDALEGDLNLITDRCNNLFGVQPPKPWLPVQLRNNFINFIICKVLDISVVSSYKWYRWYIAPPEFRDNYMRYTPWVWEPD